MQKLRYLAYDFNMEGLVKIIFARKGRLITPAFEKGRILIKESQIQDIERADFYLMPPPKDEEAEASQIFANGFSKSIDHESFGIMLLNKKGHENKNAKFSIAVDKEERNKGYGTALLNAGAKYSRSIGVEKIYGTLLIDKEIKRRVDFYQKLNMQAGLGEEEVSARVNNPKLNELVFTTNHTAEEIWNSFV